MLVFMQRKSNNPREIVNYGSHYLSNYCIVRPPLDAIYKSLLLVLQSIVTHYLQRRKLRLIEIKYLAGGHRASKWWSWASVPALSDSKACVRLTSQCNWRLFLLRVPDKKSGCNPGREWLSLLGFCESFSEEGSPRSKEFWLNIPSLITWKYAAVPKWRGASLRLLWNVSSPVECFRFADEFGKTSENTSSP